MENDSQKSYELAVILANEADEPQITTLIGQDKISFRDGPRAINFSYPIKKQTSGLLYIYQFSSPSDKAEELRRQLDQEPAILRSLLITPPLQPSRVQPPRKEETTIEVKPVVPEGAITNEALEQALKEIL